MTLTGFIALRVTLLRDLTRSFRRTRLKPYGFSCPADSPTKLATLTGFEADCSQSGAPERTKCC